MSMKVIQYNCHVEPVVKIFEVRYMASLTNYMASLSTLCKFIL